MNVKIKTVYGELSFNMSQANALAIIASAHDFARGYVGDCEDRPHDGIDAVAYAMDAAAIAKAARPVVDNMLKPAMRLDDAPAVKKNASRLESLFGNRDAWSMPAKETAPEPEPKADEEQEGEPESYKGFLYIECEECHAIKGFHVKYPLTYHKCECGHETELRNLRPAHVKCECGYRFTYNTNLQCEEFTIDCLHCGSPVDMELGAKATAFVTVAFSEEYKHRGEKR